MLHLERQVPVFALVTRTSPCYNEYTTTQRSKPVRDQRPGATGPPDRGSGASDDALAALCGASAPGTEAQ